MFKKGKKLVALVLSIIMIMSALPMNAFALTGSEEKTESAANAVFSGKEISKTVDAQGEVDSSKGSGGTYGALPSASTWGSGSYNVSGTKDFDDGVTISSGATVYLWLEEDSTLTIKGKNGTDRATEQISNASAQAGEDAFVGLTISSGAKLVIEGPGSLVITGGTGGQGWGYQATKHDADIRYSGYDGGRGGAAIKNSGSLEFGKSLTGLVTITGGTGGRGGDGQGGKNNVGEAGFPNASAPKATGIFVGGDGGNGGIGGYAVDNSGTIIFSQDNGNLSLEKDGTYASGIVNIKGGTGGVGGTGGHAGTPYIQVSTNTESGLKTLGYKEGDAGFNNSPVQGGSGYEVKSVLSPTSDQFTVYPTAGGKSGFGLGNIGVSGGTIEYNRGTATIEGGNGKSGTFGLAGGAALPFNSVTGRTTIPYTYAEQTKTPWTWPSGGSLSYGAVQHFYKKYPRTITPTAAGTSPVGSGAAGTQDVTIKNNGGTNYITGGYSSANAQASATTGTLDIGTNGALTGSLYIGSETGYNPSNNIAHSVRTLYLEGYDKFVSAGNPAFAESAKNFYVLNKGDKWVDVDGTTHTSNGLIVNGKEIITKDVYVSPQGYLYFTFGETVNTVDFDVAINATRHGEAGSETKEVRLNIAGAGVYHFSSEEGDAGVNARWAVGYADDGASQDSAFDVTWLKKVNFSEEVKINTAPQLAAISWAVNNGIAGAAQASYILENNIDLGNFYWTPIGTESQPFKGKFNGNGKTVQNVRVREIDSVNSYGLFGRAEKAEIYNFTINRDNFKHALSDTFKNNGVVGLAQSGANYNILDINTMSVLSEEEIKLGAVVGHAIDSSVRNVTADNIPIEAVSLVDGDIYVGGIVGHAKGTSLTDNKVVNAKIAPVEAELGDAYLGGIAGLAEESEIIDNSIDGEKLLSATSDDGNAWASGVVGKVTGTTTTAATVSGNTVNVTSTALTTEIEAVSKNNGAAYAGGIVGQGLEATVFSNQFLSENSASLNKVTALANDSSAWAGGLIGYIKNEGYAKVAVSDMTISNIAVKAAGVTDGTSSGDEAYAGSILGQALAKNGVELTNLLVKGTGDAVSITARAKNNAYTGRLAGHVNRATIINCQFNNHLQTSKTVKIEATSNTKDTYVGGLVGKITEEGSVNISGVHYTDIEADAYGTAWAGGLLGYADDTSIASSDVNRFLDGTTENFGSSRIDVNSSNTYVGGIAGEILNTGKIRTDSEQTYKMNSAVSVTMVLPEENVIAGGLYGKLNDGLIGTSYARDYVITNTSTNTADNATPPDISKNIVAGVVGKLDKCELIGSYGVGKSGAVVRAYPGMYHTGVGNRFYGTYALHDSFAINPSKDGNDYANTFYVDDTADVPNSLNTDHAETVEEAIPYYVVSGDTFELRTSYKSEIDAVALPYKYTKLQVAPTTSFNAGDAVNDSMWTLLHFYRNQSGTVGEQAVAPSLITTQYEARLGYSLEYNREDGLIPQNFHNPKIVPPHDLTVAIVPGTDYGHLKANEAGKNTFSDLEDPQTKSYTPDTKLVFTAEEQATLPSDVWFYSFKNWLISSNQPVKTWDWDGKDKVENPDKTYTSGAIETDPQIRVIMPGGFVVLAAYFNRNDNFYRAMLNQAISEAMKNALTDSAFEDKLNDLIAADKSSNTEQAIALMLDKLEELGDTGMGLIYDAFETYILDPDMRSSTTGKKIEEVYPTVNVGLFRELADPNMVAKQITRDAIDTVMKSKTFTAGSFTTDISVMTREDDEETDVIEGGKAEYVDVGVDIFTTGNFNKYTSSQYIFETSGSRNTGDSNTKSGIESANGMEITISTLFNGVGNPAKLKPNADSDSYAHGVNGGVYISYTDPASLGTAQEDENGAIWIEVEEQEDGSYKIILDEEKITSERPEGDYYIYLKEVDENGYEVVTRVHVGMSEQAAENIAINVDSEGNPLTNNLDLGNGESVGLTEDGKVPSPLRTDGKALWFGEVQLAESNKNPESKGDIGGTTDNPNITDHGAYYSNERGGEQEDTVFTTTEISGAYAQGIYLEVSLELIDDPEALPAGSVPIKKILENPVSGELEEVIVGYEVPVDKNAVGSNFELTGLIVGTDAFDGAVLEKTFADGTFAGGSFTYKPRTGITVKAKYKNLIGEINAADDVGDISALDEIREVVTEGYFGEVMGIAEEVMDYYTDLSNKLEIESPDEFTVMEELIEKLRPDSGYKNADEIRDLFTYTSVLNELVDLVDELIAGEGEITLESLTPADKELILALKGYADKLINGNDYITGNPLDTNDLLANLKKIYNTAESLYQVLADVRFDTVTLTVKTNNSKLLGLNDGIAPSKPSLVDDVLFGNIPISVPKAARMSAFVADNTETIDARVIVIQKNSEDAVVEIDMLTMRQEGYQIKTIKLNGTNIESLSSSEINVDESDPDKTILTVSKAVANDNIVVEVLFETAVYLVNIPNEVTNISSEKIAGVETLPARDDVTGNIEVNHGDDIIVTLNPEMGYNILPGVEITYTYVDASGNVQTDSAVVLPDGTIKIPAVTGPVTIEETELEKAIVSDNDAPSAYEDALSDLINSVGDRENFTPDTWKNVHLEVESSKKLLNDGGYSADDLLEAYDNLKNAIDKLIPQYEIVLKPGQVIPELIDKDFVDNAAYPAYGDVESVEFLQSGVVAIDYGGGSVKYYVQDNKNVTVQDNNVPSGERIESAEYISGTNKKPVVVVDDNVIIIPNVKDKITNITPTSAEKSFEVADDISKENAAGESGVENISTLPELEFSYPDDENATNIELEIKDENGNDIKIEIELDTSEMPTGSITVTVPDGEGGSIDIVVNIDSEILDKITVETNSPDKTLTIPSEVIDEIIDEYNRGNNGNNKPKIIIGENTEIGGELTTDGATGTVTLPSTNTEIIEVPKYVITPNPGKHVESVTVDGKDPDKAMTVELPNTEDVLANMTDENKNIDGSYIYVDENTGAIITVKPDSSGKPAEILVNPEASEVVVKFPVDIKKDNYGTAEIIWKNENDERHTVSADIELNIYPVSVKPEDINNGIISAGSDKVTHGGTSEITLKPDSGFKVDLDTKVTITMPSVQGQDSVTIVDTIRNLKDAEKYPNIEIEGLNKYGDSDIGTEITIVINKVTGPLNVTVSDKVFTLDNAAKAKEDLELALDELKKSIDKGDYIVDNKTELPYVTTDNEWKNFVGIDDKGGELSKASDKLYDKLIDPDVWDIINNAETESEILSAVNDALGTKYPSVSSIINAIDSARENLDDAIINLNIVNNAGNNFIPVLPSITDEVAIDEGIDADRADEILVKPDNGFINSGNGATDEEKSLVVDKIPVLPGNEIDKIIITVTDPDTGKIWEVEIPADKTPGGPSIDGENPAIAQEIDPDTGDAIGEPVEIDLSGNISPGDKGGHVGTNPDGSKNVTIPSETIENIFDELTNDGNGIITDIGIGTGEIKDIDVSKNPPSTDTGIDEALKPPTLSTTDSESTINLGSNGIVVSDIVPENEYTYKGIEVTVYDKNKDEYHIITFPSTTGNTTADKGSGYETMNDGDSFKGGNTDNEGDYETTITPQELEDAVKEVLGNSVNFDDVTITDVKVITDAVPVDIPTGEANGGNGINTDTSAGGSKPIVEIPNVGADGDDSGIDKSKDVVIDNITTEPGFEVDHVTIDITDPTTGETIKVIIPVTDENVDNGNLPSGGSGGSVVTIIKPDGTKEELDINESKGASLDDGTLVGSDKVIVPGGTIGNIIDALKDKTNSSTDVNLEDGYVSGITVDGGRKGYAIPEEGTSGTGIFNEKGVDPITIEVKEGSNPSNVKDFVIPVDVDGNRKEDLVIGNIETDNGFTISNVELTITNPNDPSKEIIITVPTNFGEGLEENNVKVTYKDENGKWQTITVDLGEVTNAVSSETNLGKTEITIPGDTLDDIIKSVTEAVTGKPVDKDKPVETDITDIKVNAKGENVINLPDKAETEDGKLVDIKEPSINEEDEMTISGIETDSTHEPDNIKVQVTVKDENGKDITYEVEIPVSYPQTTIGETVTAKEVDSKTDKIKPDGKEVEIDISKDLGGELILEPDGTYTIKVPGETIQDIIDKLSPDLGSGGPYEGDISKVVVEEERTGHGLPDKVTVSAGSIGIEDDTEPHIVTRPGTITTVTEEMNHSKGIMVTDVRADKDDETVKKVEITVGDTVIIVDTDGNITAEIRKDGKPVETVELPDELKAEVIGKEVVDESGNTVIDAPYTINVSGGIVDKILEKTGEKDSATVDKVIVITSKDGSEEGTEELGTGSGIAVGVKPDKQDNTNPNAVSKTDDLIIDNIKLTPGFEVDNITLTVKDDEGNNHKIVVPNESYVDQETGKIVIDIEITSGGNTESKTIELPQHVVTDNGSHVGSEKVVIPGESLDAIISGILNTDEIVGDISKIEVGTKLDGYEVGPAHNIHERNPEGLDKLIIKADTGETFLEIIRDATGNVIRVNSDENTVIVSKQGTLTIDMTFVKDDILDGQTYPNYHTLNSIIIDGVELSIKELEKQGALTWTNGGNPVEDTRNPYGTIELDVSELVLLYEASTGKDFPGFGDMTLNTVPQNTQYKSVISKYDKVKELLDKNHDDDGEFNFDTATESERKEFEDLVYSLADNFGLLENPKDLLKEDNLSHLIDKQAEVNDWLKQIEERRGAEVLAKEIDDLYEELKDKIKDLDLNKGQIDISNPDDFDKIIDIIDNANKKPTPDDAAVEDLDKIKDIIDEIIDVIDDLNDRYDNLTDKGQELVDRETNLPGNWYTDDGKNTELNEINDIIDKIKEAELGEAGYVIDLINNLPSCPDIHNGVGGVNDWDSFRDNSVFVGKNLDERIRELVKYQKAVEKAQNAYDNLSPEDRLTIPNAVTDILTSAQVSLDKEYKDLAEVFVRDYATTDSNHKDEYNGGNGVTSEDSVNGIKIADSNIKNTIAIAKSEYEKLSNKAKEYVDKLFFGPTIPELYEEAFKKNDALKVGLELILEALDKNKRPNDVNYLKPSDIDNNYANHANKVLPSDKDKTVSEWIDIVFGLEDIYNSLSESDKKIVDDTLKAQAGGIDFPSLLQKAKEEFADKFIKDHELNSSTLNSGSKDKYTGKDIANILATERDYNKLTSKQKEAVNNTLKKDTGYTYPELLNIAKSTDNLADKDYVSDALEKLKEEYDKLVNKNDYTDENRELLDSIYNQAKKDLENAIKDKLTKHEVDKILNQAITDMRKVPTKSGGESGGGSGGDEEEITPPDDNGISNWLITDKHIMYLNGYEDGNFRIENNMTRAEVAKMFYNLLIDKDVRITKSFNDVDESKWYSKAINTLASLNIINGYKDGSFHPDSTITRAEFVTVAMNFAYEVDGAFTDFVDVDNGHWAYKNIASASYYGWISGYKDGGFHPKENITRGEVTKIVNTMLGRMPDKTYIDSHDSDIKIFPDIPVSHWAFYEVVEATNEHDFDIVDGKEIWK